MLQRIAVLAVLALAGCSKSDCKQRIAKLRERLAALKASPRPPLATWEADGTGRTSGAIRVRVTDDANMVTIDDGPPAPLAAAALIAEAERRGRPVIELDAPGTLQRYGELIDALMRAGELHVMVAVVQWPPHAESDELHALRQKLVRTVDDESFYAFGDTYRRVVGDRCRQSVDEGVANIRGLPTDRQDAKIKQEFAARLEACDCKDTDVDSFGALVALFFLPQYETGWVRFAPGPITIGTDFTLDAFVSNALMAEPPIRRQGFKLLVPRR